MRKFLLALLTLASCSKDNNCETFTWYDECIPKNSLTFCNNPNPPNYITRPICGDALDGVKHGGTKVVHESADAKIVRHYQ